MKSGRPRAPVRSPSLPSSPPPPLLPISSAPLAAGCPESPSYRRSTSPRSFSWRTANTPAKRPTPHLGSLVEALISSPLLEGRLCYFKLEQLRSGAGYAEALAATIGELSRAALTPSALREAADPGSATGSRLKDIAAVWEALESQASSHDCTTRSRVLNRATALLSRNPSLFPLQGRTLAFIDEQTTNTHLRLPGRHPPADRGLFPGLPRAAETARPPGLCRIASQPDAARGRILRPPLRRSP